MAETDVEAFRAEVRQWLEANCPPSLRTPAPEDEDVWGGTRGTFKHPDSRGWLERAADRGFTAPTWPKKYGGAGLSREEAAVLQEEMRRLGCRLPLKSLGVWLLGPVLLAHGTEEQKTQFLPPMARGEARWCQGYSEPGAGSDLASLATSAVRDGDSYVVNGQKTWTSQADQADFMFCLVRTGTGKNKHDGISFLLIDMTSPGVSVKPILLISGSSPFCETFFEDVRVPAKNLLGAEHQGWGIAKELLSHERAAISSLRDASVEAEQPLQDLAKRLVGLVDGKISDPVIRDKITQSNLDVLCNQLTLKRSAESMAAGRGPGSETSMFKYYAAEMSKRRKELKVVICGFAGLGWEGHDHPPKLLTFTREWLRSRANSIEGGTSEVQLNIIAKRVLGLPD